MFLIKITDTREFFYAFRVNKYCRPLFLPIVLIMPSDTNLETTVDGISLC